MSRLRERREQSVQPALMLHDDIRTSEQMKQGENTENDQQEFVGPTPENPVIHMAPTDWVRLLNGPDHAISGWVEYRFIDKRCSPVRVERRWIKADAAQLSPGEVHQHANAGKNIFFGLSLRRSGGLSGDGACLPTPLLWADLDLKDLPGAGNVLAMPAAALHALKVRLFHQLMDACHDMPPLAVVDSGHGLQVIFRRSGGRETHTRELNVRLAMKFAALGADGTVTNPERVFRLPGSLNLKNPERPLIVTVWHLNPDSYMSVEAEQGLPDAPPAAPRKTVKRAESDRHASPGTRHKGLPAMRNPHRYVLAVLKSEAAAVARTTDGLRNKRLNLAAFQLSLYVDEGLIPEAQVIQVLTEVARQCGLAELEILPTIRSGLRGVTGKQSMRQAR